MRALSSGMPRCFRDHRSNDGRAYRLYCRGVIARLGKLPDHALTTLREAARLSVELHHMGLELEAARSRRRRRREGPVEFEAARRRDVARLRRAMIPMRTQLLTFEHELDKLAEQRPASFAQVVNGNR